MKLDELNDRVLCLLTSLLNGETIDKVEVERLIKKIKDTSLKEPPTKIINNYSNFDNTHDAVAIYEAVDNGKNFKIVYFNSIAEKIEQINKAKVIGKNVTDVFPGVIKFGLFDVLKKVWETGTPVNHPISIYEDNRILGWRENYVYKIATGEVVATYRDITKQKQAEAEVIKSESKLKSLINNKKESIWSIDSDYNFIIFNDFFKEQYYLIHKIILDVGINALDLLTQDLYVLWKENYDRALSGERVSFEFSTKIKKKLNFFEVWLNPIITKGEITGVSVSSINITERIDKSKALFESEEKYKQITESSLDIIFQINKRGKLLFFNDSLEKVLGYTKEEAVGKSFRKFVPLKEIPKYVVNLSKIFSEEPIEYFNTQIYHKDGHLVDVEVSGSLIKQKGKLIGQGTIRDISERVKIENALKEREENYRGIFNSTSDAIYIQNSDGIFIDVNIGASKMYGYSREYFIGKTPEFIGAPGKNDLNKVMKFVKSAFNGNEEKFEYWGQRKNGEIFPKDVTLNPGMYNGEKVVIAVAKDVSERWEFQKKINASEEKFKNILHFAPDAFFHGNKNGDFIECNEAASLLTGFSKKELLQMNMKSFFTDATLNKKPMRYDLLENGKTYRTEREIITKNGDVKFIEMNSKKMNDGTLQSFVRDITERKNAEEALIASETNYKLIAEKASDVVWLMDLNGKSLFVTPSIKKFTGYSVKEYISQSLEDRFTTKSASVAHSILTDELTKYKRRKISKDYSKRIELDYKCKDGSVKTGELLVTPFFGKDNSLIGIHGVTRDITERKKAEKNLKESEKNFRLLFENSPLGTYIATPKGEIIDGNSALLKMMGSPSIEATKQINVLDYLPLVNNGYAKKFKECVKSNKTLSFSIKYKSKWGNERIFSSYLIPLSNAENKVQSIYTIMEDITDKKNAELALKESEKKYRLISNITSDYIYEAGENRDGAFDTKWVGGSFEKITGFSLEEYIKSGGWKAHLHPKDVEKDNQALLKLKNNEATSLEVRIFNKDGKVVWIRNVCLPIWDKKNNKLSGMIGACSDITEKKKMVEELILSKEKAERSEKIKTEFLAQMSHEIRSPLNTIMSFIELIKEEVSEYLSEDLTDSFQSIESASTRIIRTIDLILNTTDLQLGTYKISVGEINVVNMLKQIRDEYTQSAFNKGLDIQLDLEFNRRKIISDEYALIQIISNLVDNAIKYTDKGFVKICACKGSKNELVIKVQDSGIGMSKKFLPNLFNSFTQEEQGYTRKYDGNGLGMALVKNYCNLISAEIIVESKKRKGTTFTLKITNLKIK